MASIGILIDKAEQIDLNQAISEAIDATAKQFIDEQKDQLLHGINSAGDPIGQYKNKRYALMKNAMNPIPGFGVPDLRLKGNFYGGLFIDARNDRIVVDSADEKAKYIYQRYGDVLGLSGQFQDQYVRVFRPEAVRNIKAQILGM